MMTNLVLEQKALGEPRVSPGTTCEATELNAQWGREALKIEPLSQGLSGGAKPLRV